MVLFFKEGTIFLFLEAISLLSYRPMGFFLHSIFQIVIKSRTI